jgi:hypothetical protein
MNNSILLELVEPTAAGVGTSIVPGKGQYRVWWKPQSSATCLISLQKGALVWNRESHRRDDRAQESSQGWDERKKVVFLLKNYSLGQPMSNRSGHNRRES